MSTKLKTNWLPLFSTNFLGVFNDNFLKYMVIFVSIAWLNKEGSNNSIIAIASALLVLPYIFFSPLAGRLALRYDKTKIFTVMKLIEIPIMLLAVVAFYFQNLYLAMFSIFLIGWQSAIYSPSKYGLIRDVGGVEGISFGTGTMEMFTFAGVLLGQVAAALLSDYYSFWVTSAVLLGIAVVGYITSRLIKVHESAPLETTDTTINPVLFLIHSIKWARQISGLNTIIVALSIFWLVASFLQMNLITFCPEQLKMSNIETGMVMSMAAIGIGLGCYIAGVISNHKVELGLVPIGGVGMSLAILGIYIFNPTGYYFMGWIFVAAFFTGLYKVPLNSWVQERVKGRMLGDILAYCNLLDFIFILISAGLFKVMTLLFTPQSVFLVIIIFMIAILGVLYGFMSEFRGRGILYITKKK